MHCTREKESEPIRVATVGLAVAATTEHPNGSKFYQPNDLDHWISNGKNTRKNYWVDTRNVLVHLILDEFGNQRL